MAGSSVVVNHAASAPVAGRDGQAYGAKGGKRPLPHIDDITSVTPAVDAHAPVEKILQIAETYLRQAESSKSFGRPDLALQDYIRTNIVLVDILKKNKGWVSLQRDNKAQFERYQRIMRQVSAIHGDFEAIKQQIKADNAISGVQPTVPRPGSAGNSVNGPAGAGTRDGSVVGRTANGGLVVQENGVATPPASPAAKAKPAVHPKPQKLQGNAVGTVKGQDLVQRFANLRAGAVNAMQDPRIRTRPIVVPEMPEPQKSPVTAPPVAAFPTVPVAAVVAQMPRLPDAIYNPARGTISSETAALPSSAPRAMFTRTNSTASLTATRSSRPALAADESSASNQTPGSNSTPAKRTKLSVPDGIAISVDDLLRFMRAGARDFTVLLIDVRSREEFDYGHIMSQATICLEPEVLSRPHISAHQIADSMVLAPATEQLLFEKRHEFDLVVFYDQSSSLIPDNPQAREERALSGLFNALSRYDFVNGPGPGPGPRLLQGGLDAWTSLVGSASLQSSSTTTSKKPSVTPLAKSFLTPRQRYTMRPIQDPAEAKRWEDTIADAGTISPIRTTEDFLRRFPPISELKESMASPVSPGTSQPQVPFPRRISRDESHYDSLPSPPTRPPPAVPRRSYSGLAEVEDSAVAMAQKASVKVSDGVRANRTGLQNPGVFCFANSSLQALFATPGFARELWTESWKDSYKVPARPDERIQNPQLLTKILADVFQWLNKGTFKSLAPKTFMSYLYHIHSKTADGRQKPDCDIFGGSAQQDAQEFYSFVLDNIHDETNIRRDRSPPKEEKPYTPKDGGVIQNAVDYWREHSKTSASIVDKYFRGLEVFISRCHNRGCQQELRLFQPCDVWILSLAGMGDETDLDSLLAKHQTSEFFDDLVCETCHRPGRSRKAKFARLPDRLVFCLNRFETDGGGSFLGLSSRSSGKLHTKVRFPVRDLDLTRYCAEPDPDAPAERRHFAGRMLYDCYAVTVHVGQGINGGHYYSYVQDETSRDPADWFKCNDDVVSRVRIGTVGGAGGAQGRGDDTEAMYQKGIASAYMIFYRRQGT